MSREKAESLLRLGVRELDIYPNEEQIKKLLDYLFLLDKWNATYNLTAVRDINSMLTHHLLDSLSVASFLSECHSILDVGSGAGLPGFVLALLYPDKRISLVDIVRKKTAFMNQVKIELGLDNVAIYTERVEKLSVRHKFDAIISRAFSSLSDFVYLSGHLLKKNGVFYAMKGLIPSDEINHLDSSWKITRIEPIKVPQLNAQRHLIVIKPA